MIDYPLDDNSTVRLVNRDGTSFELRLLLPLPRFVEIPIAEEPRVKYLTEDEGFPMIADPLNPGYLRPAPMRFGSKTYHRKGETLEYEAAQCH